MCRRKKVVKEFEVARKAGKCPEEVQAVLNKIRQISCYEAVKDDDYIFVPNIKKVLDGDMNFW
jgi:hypothetical protein